MATLIQIFGVPGVSGESQRARVYNPDGSTNADIALTEEVNGSAVGRGVYNGTASLSLADATDPSRPYTIEVLSVTAQTSVSFDASTTVRRTKGGEFWIKSGAWLRNPQADINTSSIVGSGAFAATRNQPFVFYYWAWDTNANGWKSNDQANHTFTGYADGNPFTPTNSAVALAKPGQYALTISATENSGYSTEVAIQSSTANVIAKGAPWQNSAGTTGAGAYNVVVTVTDGVNPLANVSLRFTGPMVPQPNGATLNDGTLTFGLDAGTYTLTATKAGYSYTATTQIITGNASISVVMTPSILPVAGAGQATGQLYTYDGQGNLAGGVEVDFELVAYKGTNSNSFGREVFPLTSATNGSGLLAGLFEQNCTYRGRRISASGHGGWVPFDTPTNNTTFNLPPILGILGI